MLMQGDLNCQYQYLLTNPEVVSKILAMQACYSILLQYFVFCILYFVFVLVLLKQLHSLLLLLLSQNCTTIHK